MAIRAKKFSGVAEPKQTGLFGSRLSKGKATGLSIGTGPAKVGVRTDTVNKQKYKIKQYGGY